MIQEVILENFKSYYGVHRLKFNGHFNAIIGPNGSGKSNFIDAIQFVFGKRATSMRCKAVQHLISAGQPYCSVEVKFEKFSIKRSANQVHSDYFVNDDIVTLTQLHEYLKYQNIEASNKFIILQGEVESIALMKPKSGSTEQPGMLEYIEEEFQKEKVEQAYQNQQKSQTQFYEANEKLNISQNTLNEIKNLVNLEDFVNRIYQKMLQSMIYQIDIQIKDKNIKDLDYKLIELQSSYNGLDELMQQSIIEYNAKKLNATNIESSIKDCESRITEIQQHILKLENRTDQDDLLNCQLDINKCEKTIEQQMVEQEILKTDMDKMEQLWPTKVQKVEKLLQTKNTYEEKYRTLKNAVNVDSRFYYSKKQELEQKIHPFTLQIKEKQQKLELLQQEFDRTNQGSTSYWNQLIELQQKTQQLCSQEGHLKLSITKQRELMDLITDQKTKTMKQLEEYKIQEKQLVQTIQSMQNRLDQSNEDRVEKNQQAIMLRALHRAAQAGMMQICGRLGDLGAIDGKYECAITTACPALDGIVVETSEDATKCIQFLKDQKLGRCLFIPLDKTPEQVTMLVDKQFPRIEGASRLFDLIQLKNERFKGVFYNFLRDTLVVNNIDDAVKIAFSQRRRIVTLDGKLIDHNGVMSGGPQIRKGGMQSKLVEELQSDQREQLIIERNRLKDQLDQTKVKITQLDSKIQEILGDEETVKSKYKQRVVDMNMLLEQINENKTQEEHIKQALQQSHLNEQRNEEIKKEMDTIYLEIKKINLRIGQEQIELNEVDKQLKDIANQDLNQAKDQFYTSSADYEQAEQEQQKLMAQKNVQQKKIIQIAQSIQDENDKLNELKKKQQIIIETKNKIAQEIIDQQNQEEIIKLEIEKINSDFNKIDSECKKVQGEIRSLKQIMEEQENDRQQIILKKNIEKKQQQELITKNSEIKQDYDEFIKSFEQDNINLLHNLTPQNTFKLQLQESFQIVKAKYSQKFREYFIPQFIDLFPEAIPMEIPLLQDLLQYSQQLPQLQEISFDSQLAEDKDKDRTLLKIYIQRSKEHEYKIKKYKEAEEKHKNDKMVYDDIYFRRRTTFEGTFTKVKKKLQEIYFQLSNGGDAELELIDSLDPFSEGLQFNVKPPNKTWKQISKLSGGEKTLASLSLMLALHFYRPTKLYILDEIDAALDFKNVGIVASYLYQIKSQFIIVSLRTNMFEKASHLVGLYIRDGQPSTQVIELDVEA